MVRSHSLYPIELRGLRDHSTAENLVRRVRHSAHAATLLQNHHSSVRIRPAPPFIRKVLFRAWLAQLVLANPPSAIARRCAASAGRTKLYYRPPFRTRYIVLSRL